MLVSLYFILFFIGRIKTLESLKINSSSKESSRSWARIANNPKRSGYDIGGVYRCVTVYRLLKTYLASSKR